MARSMIAVIVGYVAMFVLVFVTFTVVFLVMGVEWSFKPKSFEASTAWVTMSLIGNFVIGVVGGLICTVISRGGKAPVILAIVVFALGLLLAIPAVIAHKQNTGEVRTGNVSQTEAMTKAIEPVWVPFAFPFICTAGVVLGGKLKRGS